MIFGENSMIHFTTPLGKDCYIDASGVAAVEAIHNTHNSKIFLKSGSKIVVCGKPETILRKLGLNW